ncbi:MAG: c-type cytochrome, partial [Bacteroidetes bacterium]|nr:c-type cytochrome [Bacteroidota bacterium]
QSWWGEEYLLNLVKRPRFDEELKTTAAGVLFNVYRITIRDEAAQYLDRPESVGGGDLPPIRDLLASTGNVLEGKKVFQTVCQTCHVIAGEGTHFGPELSAIGSKLSKEGLLRSILYPDEGINYDYAGYTLTLKDGTKVAGIKTSENASMIEMRLIGGMTNQYQKSQVESLEEMPQSLMPNLTSGLSQDQIVDLVEYLAGLGKEG